MNTQELFNHTVEFGRKPDTQHHFGAGVYAKEMHIPKGHVGVSHKHNYDHLSILARGKVAVVTDEHKIIYDAPAVVTIRARMHHAIYALEDTVWYCIHPTDETDPAKVDEVAIMKE